MGHGPVCHCLLHAVCARPAHTIYISEMVRHYHPVQSQSRARLLALQAVHAAMLRRVPAREHNCIGQLDAVWR